MDNNSNESLLDFSYMNYKSNHLNPINTDQVSKSANKQPYMMPQFEFNSESKGKIMKFSRCSEQIQNLISSAFIDEWEEDFALQKIYSNQDVKKFIIESFKDRLNIFFVYVSMDNEFIATFSIDTANLAPYIAHLYINPNLRSKGIGHKLLIFAENYIKNLGFLCANLWCEKELTPYYKKFNYIVLSDIQVSPTKYVYKMGKNLD